MAKLVACSTPGCRNTTSSRKPKPRCKPCYMGRGIGADGGGKIVKIASVCGHRCEARGSRYCGACKANGYRTPEQVAADEAAKAATPPKNKLSDKPTATFESSGDRAEVGRITDVNVKTLDDLIRVCEIDTEIWRVEKWVANKWEMGAKDNAGNLVSRPLYQVKAWLVRNVALIQARNEIAALIEDAKAQIEPRAPVPRLPSDGFMLEIAVPDLHLGKLAWAPETGGDHYDSHLAADIFRQALEALIQRTSAFGFDRVVFPVGNDFFHSDSKTGTTTKGTPLDNDSRFHKTFVVGRRLLTWAIDRLRELAPVEVVIVPGNHDTMAAFHVGDSLECLYHSTADVTIRNEPIPRKYVDYGRNLILFTHSDKGKKDKLPLLMATERSEQFGRALFREAHVGHTHESQLQEHMGVRVRVSPALCAPDAWHSENHFVGNLRRAEAIVWSKHEGDVATASFTVPRSNEVESK